MVFRQYRELVWVPSKRYRFCRCIRTLQWYRALARKRCPKRAAQKTEEDISQNIVHSLKLK